MRIAAHHSHLNGLEYLEARKPHLLAEIQDAIASVDAEACRNKASKEKTMAGRMLYSPKAMNAALKERLSACDPGWKPATTSYWVCEDARINRRNIDLGPADQKRAIEAAGLTAIRSSNQTDFVKERVAVEVQFGKYAFVAFDLFVKHMAFYVADRIDLGIEIMPMKCLQKEMSSGPCYYERELNNLIREGRGVPPVPLVLFGIAP
jgi:hypothetical protein